MLKKPKLAIISNRNGDQESIPLIGSDKKGNDEESCEEKLENLLKRDGFRTKTPTELLQEIWSLCSGNRPNVIQVQCVITNKSGEILASWW